MTSKTVSQIFPVMFQSLLKPHYVYSFPMAHLWLLFKKMRYQEENYNFWDFFTTIFDIKCGLWMKLAPALVPLEAWFWYMLFLDLLSLNQHSMTSKTVSQIFPVMFQSLLKPHYVYTAWLHKISPTLIVCRICSINSIRNLTDCFADNIFLIKSLLIYDSRSILKCSHGTFVTFIQENGVQRWKLQFLGFSSKIVSQIFPVMFESLL
jgi:hypothetical protein